MHAEPPDLDPAQLRRALEERWGVDATSLAYQPVGHGSHHWLATGADGHSVLASVDDLEAPFQAGPDADASYAALERAYRTGLALQRDADLEFVVAPLPDRNGTVLARLGNRYCLRVEPFVSGRTRGWGTDLAPDDRRRTAALIGRLHAATGSLPAGLPSTDPLDLTGRDALEGALAQLDVPWHNGPYAEPARTLLSARARSLRERLRAYDALAAAVARRPVKRVITHGEPHPGNLLHDPQGGLHLIDWDTVRLAHPERDLRYVLDEGMEAWPAYAAHAGAEAPDLDALELYRLRWDLEDIAIFIAGFRRPHVRSADTDIAWQDLAACLEG